MIPVARHCCLRSSASALRSSNYHSLNIPANLASPHGYNRSISNGKLQRNSDGGGLAKPKKPKKPKPGEDYEPKPKNEPQWLKSFVGDQGKPSLKELEEQEEDESEMANRKPKNLEEGENGGEPRILRYVPVQVHKAADPERMMREAEKRKLRYIGGPQATGPTRDPEQVRWDFSVPPKHQSKAHIIPSISEARTRSGRPPTISKWSGNATNPAYTVPPPHLPIKIEKAFPVKKASRYGLYLQGYRLVRPIEFTCVHCRTRKTKRYVVVQDENWDTVWCNLCHIAEMKKKLLPAEKGRQFPIPEGVERITNSDIQPGNEEAETKKESAWI